MLGHFTLLGLSQGQAEGAAAAANALFMAKGTDGRPGCWGSKSV